MNWKLTTIASLGLSTFLYVGCTNAPPTNLIIDTSGGSGGATGSTGTTIDTTSSTGSGSLSSPAQQYFLTYVYPQLDNDCAQCHGTSVAPPFFGTTPEATYNAMDNYGGLIVAPENSLLILHGAHTGPALTQQEVVDVTAWLNMEVQERGLSGGTTAASSGSGGTTAMTLDKALKDYGACMDQAEWVAYGLDKLPSQQTANGGPCNSCHSAGEGGCFLSLNVDETFQKNALFPFIKRQVTGTVDMNGSFADLIPSNRFSQKGAEPCQPGTNCHPKFALPPDIKNGIDMFVQSTIDKWHNKLCAAPMP